MSPMRIVFMGTPDFAVPSASRDRSKRATRSLAVYTQPPRRAGRGMALRKSPIQAAAEAARLTVLTPERLKKRRGAGTLPGASTPTPRWSWPMG